MNRKTNLKRLIVSLAAGATLMANGCGGVSLASLSQAILVGGVNSVFSDLFGLSSITGFSSNSLTGTGAAQPPVLVQPQSFSSGASFLAPSSLGLGGSNSILNFASPSLF